MFETHIEGFWKRVDKLGPDECWIWRGCHRPPNPCGMVYGAYSLYLDGKTKNYRAHRLAWMLANGSIPEGKVIMHTCDVPLCVNPEHLRCGTQADNIHDRDRKGRQLRGETHNMVKLTEENVMDIRSSNDSDKEMAQRYGVHESTIYGARVGRKWKHLPLSKENR